MSPHAGRATGGCALSTSFSWLPEKQVLNPIFSPLPIGEPGGQGETDGAGMLGGHFPPQSPPSLVLQLSIQMGNAIPPWVSRLQGAQ